MTGGSRARLRRAYAEQDETEAFAQMLYSAFGGFVDWDLLPSDSRSKDDYREKARLLLDFLETHRERHGKVTIPREPTPEMVWYQIIGDEHDIHAHLVERAEVEPIDGILTIWTTENAMKVVISPMWTPDDYAVLNAFVGGPEDTFEYPTRGARYVPPL